MKKKVKDLWVAALRSGKYKQGTHRLRGHNNRYCCLGVLCEISDLPYTGSASGLPYSIEDWAGMGSSLGRFGNRDLPALFAMNDILGRNFNEIADVIDQHWEAL